MIITLKGANFSASNIGQLDSWFITKDFGSGVNYSGPTSVKKNAALNATITISSGYELNGSVSVTMGGSQVTSGVTTSGNTITISIASVTGAVTIKVPTKSTAGGGGSEEPDTPDVPSGSQVIKFDEQDLQSGYVTNSGQISSGGSHYYFTISAEGLESITFTAKCTGIASLPYFVHKAANGTIVPYANIMDYTAGQTVTIPINTTDGIMYVNAFAPADYQGTHYEYHTEIIVKYS